MKYILISGPPGSGKDTASGFIWDQVGWGRSTRAKFAAPLIIAAQAMGFDMDESVKDMPDPYLHVTRRDFQIAFSDELCKPRMGEKVFGQALVARMTSRPCDLVIVSDSGFLPEAQAVIDSVGMENVVRLHLHRAGHDYSKDSRSDWDVPTGMARYDILNNGDLGSFRDSVNRFCKIALGGS